MTKIGRANIEYIDHLLEPGTSTFICGLRNYGKSYFAQAVCRRAPSVFVIDPMDEYGDIPNALAYVPEHRSYSRVALREIDQALTYFLGMENRAGLLIFDEVVRYAPNKRIPPEKLAEINDLMAHYDLACIWIARRPADVWTPLVETANNIMVFHLAGRNDHLYLRNRVSPQAAEQSHKLKRYEHLYIGIDRQATIMPPLPA